MILVKELIGFGEGFGRYLIRILSYKRSFCKLLLRGNHVG